MASVNFDKLARSFDGYDQTLEQIRTTAANPDMAAQIGEYASQIGMYDTWRKLCDRAAAIDTIQKFNRLSTDLIQFFDSLSDAAKAPTRLMLVNWLMERQSSAKWMGPEHRDRLDRLMKRGHSQGFQRMAEIAEKVSAIELAEPFGFLQTRIERVLVKHLNKVAATLDDPEAGFETDRLERLLAGWQSILDTLAEHDWLYLASDDAADALELGHLGAKLLPVLLNRMKSSLALNTVESLSSQLPVELSELVQQARECAQQWPIDNGDANEAHMGNLLLSELNEHDLAGAIAQLEDAVGQYRGLVNRLSHQAAAGIGPEQLMTDALPESLQSMLNDWRSETKTVADRWRQLDISDCPTFGRLSSDLGLIDHQLQHADEKLTQCMTEAIQRLDEQRAIMARSLDILQKTPDGEIDGFQQQFLEFEQVRSSLKPDQKNHSKAILAMSTGFSMANTFQDQFQQTMSRQWQPREMAIIETLHAPETVDRQRVLQWLRNDAEALARLMACGVIDVRIHTE